MDIETILRDHVLWVKDEGGERAYMRDANLRGANLRGADLRGANLRDANLRDAKINVLTFQAAKHQAIFCGGHGSIGCEYHTYQYWIENGSKIGADNGYTDDEIKRYMAMIEIGINWLRTVENEDGSPIGWNK